MMFRFPRALFLSLLLAVTAAAPAGAATGGRLVAQDDALAAMTVGLRFAEYNGHEGTCTGTLLSDRLILTAAHCLQGTRPDIYFGVDMDGSPRVVHADAMFVPADFQDDTRQHDRHDIGLVRFSGGLPAGFHAAPLLRDPGALHFWKRVTVAGFGTDELDGPVSHSGRLKRVHLRISGTRYSPTEVETAQSTWEGICPGDSGGPAFITRHGRYELWGVVNLGVGGRALLGRCGMNSVFADVAAPALRDWIARVSGSLDRLACPYGDCDSALPVR